MRRTIRTVGTIDYNETALADVTTKFKGWIEKLYVNATGQLVIAAIRCLKFIRRNFTARRPNICWRLIPPTIPARRRCATAALTKLKFFDISDAQIAELERTGQPRRRCASSRRRTGL